MMNKISAVFGSHVFSDQVMRERLPKAVTSHSRRLLTRASLSIHQSQIQLQQP